MLLRDLLLNAFEQETEQQEVCWRSEALKWKDEEVGHLKVLSDSPFRSI